MSPKRRQSGTLMWRCSRIPRSVPAGRVLVHNHVAHAVDTQPGYGFHAWTQARDKTLVRCTCGWSGLPHFRVRGKGNR